MIERGGGKKIRGKGVTPGLVSDSEQCLVKDWIYRVRFTKSI